MSDLNQIRKRINELDAALKPLLAKRMDLAAQVAASKAASAKQSGQQPVIFVKVREEEILQAVDAAEHTIPVRQLMKEVMGYSRQFQYRLLLESKALRDDFAAYKPGEICVLSLTSPDKLTEALTVICRYAVKVVKADGDEIALVAEDVRQMQILRVQLSKEGYIKA